MNKSNEFRLRPPAAVWTFTELPRALGDYAGFAVAQRWLAKGRAGNDRPVLVLPGLLADDRSTAPLRRLLKASGYYAYGWQQGRNIGPTRKIISGMDDRLARIADRHQQPVSVIGWSLGGIFAAEIARRNPGSVDRLITLGSPLYIEDPCQSRASYLYDMYASEHLLEFAFDTWRAAPAPEVPSTSIYSKADGIVHWRTCLHPSRPLAENIQVYASHTGLGFHPAALYAVMDRLAAPIDPWVQFRAPAHLAVNFPTQVDVVDPGRTEAAS